MVHHQSLIDIAATPSVASSLALSSVPQSSFCIGDLEHALHITFAATRVAKGGRYVWVGQDPPNMGVEGQIAAYIDGKDSHSANTPLVLSGPSGVGKSALLANWLLRHESAQRRSKSQQSEFVFWHVVGSSRQSTYTYELLRRLMNELKSFFELTPTVHAQDEKLPWDLPRFLALAAKKGRVLIIIDGLHRLRSDVNGDGDLGLKWLPLTFPSNIKVIISSTSPQPSLGGEDDDFFDTGNAEDDAIGASEGKKERVLGELKRRKWRIVEMASLKPATSTEIFKEFLVLSSKEKAPTNKAQQVAAMNAANAINAINAANATNAANAANGSEPGSDTTFNLTAVNSVPAPAPALPSPRLEHPGLLLYPSQKRKILSDAGATNPLFLRTLLHAAEYAANAGYDLWACVDKWMDGADDVNRLYAQILETLEEGAPMPSKKQCADAKQRCVEDGGLKSLMGNHPWHRLHDVWMVMNAMHDDESVGSHSLASQGAAADMDVIFEKKEDEVVQEKLMQEAGSMADRKLQTVRDDADKKLGSLYADIAARLNPSGGQAPIDGNQFLAWLDSQEGRDAIPFENEPPPVEKPPRSLTKQKSAKLVDAQAEEEEEDEYGDEDYEDEEYEEEDFEAEEHTESVPGDSRSGTPASPKRGSSLTAENSLSMSHSHSALPTFASERARIAKESEARRQSVKQQVEASNIDLSPFANSEDLSMVPQYLKGGKQVNGFGPLLGYALALLYVSRHGLRESELFELLVRIKGQDDYTKSTKGTEAEAEMKLFHEMTKHKLRLIDAFKSLDRDGNGVVSHDEFRAGIIRMHVDITQAQIDMLISSMDENHDGVIDFHEALDRFEKHARDYSHGKHRIPVDPEETSIESGSIAEKKSNIGEMDLDFLNDSVAPGSVPQNQALGAVVEASLLTALTNLGVIHAQKEQVLMLPLEAEALREVIWWRYVGSTEGQDKWHSHIVSFFMDQEPSIRRCEELPWHLHRCRRWSALRNTLVDLRTFDLMYNRRIQLRGELFNYWKTLIEGPLYTSDEAEHKAYQNKIELPNNEQLLIELDTASRLGHSDSQLRKERLRGQLAPFDIVDEYNRAVETWHSAVRPNTKLMEKLITNLSEFMVWFSDNMNAISDPPPFLRKTLKFEQLSDVGVDQLDSLINVTLVNHDDERQVNIEELAAAAKPNMGSISPVPFSPEKYSVGAPGLIKPHLYYFNRWIWIMFPWMALKNANAYSEQMAHYGKSAYDCGPGGEHRKPPLRRGSLFGNDDMDKIVELEKNGGGDDEGSMTGSIMSSGVPRKIRGAGSSKKKESMFWQVKKMDPRADPVNKPSKLRDEAMVHAVVGDRSAPNKMSDRLSEENRLLGIAPKEKPRPPRMALEPKVKEETRKFSDDEYEEGEEEKKTETIHQGEIQKTPFAYSSVKSQKHGSRFPSVEKFHKMKVEADEQAMDKTTARAIERFGGQEVPQNLMELVALKNSEEMPMSQASGGDLGFLPAHSLTFPTTNEDAILAQGFARAGKLRMVYDKLRLEAKIKSDKLEDMNRTVQERDRKDGMTVDNMDDGEKIMDMLGSRLRHMDDAVINARFLGEFYDRIIEVLETNPAKDKKHLDALEQQLSLSKQQIDDMLKRRNNLYLERDDIEKRQQVRYAKEINKTREKKLAIEPKVDSKKLEVEETQRKVDERSHGGGLGNLFGRSGSSSPSSAKSSRPVTSDLAVGGDAWGAKDKTEVTKSIAKASLSGLGGLAGAMSAQASDYKRTLVLTAMEKLEDLAGTTNGDELIAKMEQNRNLLKTLTNQKTKFEEKVGSLKKERVMLQRELEELQFAGEENVGEAGSSGTDVRKMDTSANKAEMRYHQNQKKVERQNTLIHYVKTGIDHLARLVDETDAACKLPVSKVHLHLLDESDIDEKVKLMSKTEDRLTSVLENLTLGSSNKHNGDDGTMSIAQKQSEQADAIHRKRVKTLGDAAQRRPKSRGGKLEDKIRPPANLDANLSSPRGIRVSVPAEQDHFYDTASMRVCREQNRALDHDEAQILGAEQDTGKEEIFKFVNESLDTRESRMEQRKAHLLMESKTSNHKDKGLTMDTVLNDMEERLVKETMASGAGLGASMKKSKVSPRSSIAVHDRGELKKISNKIKKAKEKEKKISDKNKAAAAALVQE